MGERVPFTPDGRVDDYEGYSGLPCLVGLHTMAEAATKGLSVAEAVSRLKILHWAFRRLHNIFVLRITATPIYELKMAFSLHAHYCIEHMGEVARRVREMRQPPYGLEVAPNRYLDAFFDEILATPTIEALLLGLYGKAIPLVVRSLEQFVADTNRLFDHPSYRVCRLALVEMRDIQDYGNRALEGLVPETQRLALGGWSSILDRLLAAIKESDGGLESNDQGVERHFSAQSYQYDPIPQRDERFRDSYNMGVNAEAMLFDPLIEPLPKTIMLYFKRMREIDVPEMMASILADESEKPWEFQRDMTRQLWDEARHAMMGEVGFVSIGVDWTEVPLNFTWSLGLNTKLSARERHAVLYTIEQGLMPRKTGKQYEWEIGVASADHLSALIQDYDWADEILHARIGRELLVPELGSQTEALAYGDQAWSSILVDWGKWRDQGLTQHRNWWPEVYRKACLHWGIEPDPQLFAYNKTYEESRADLKQVAG